MSEYIKFPRYSIYLIPSESFFTDLNLFYEKNNLDLNKLPQSIYGIHYTVKAPFYKSHLYSENDLINRFNSIDKNKILKIFEKKFNVIKFEKFNKNLVLELESDEDFNFYIHDLMRSFDLFRVTFDTDEIKKDLLRFEELSDKELMYYQIWGYPYYFECAKHHISLTNFNPKFKKHNFLPVKYNSLKLLKQNGIDDRFKELSSLL